MRESQLPLLLYLFLSILFGTIFGQDDLGTINGFVDVETSNFKARFVRDSQVLASLKLIGDDFDFLPFDVLENRSRNGQYHWGDITYRHRAQGDTTWVDGDSSQQRKPVIALSQSDNILVAADLSSTLPSGPLNVTREWLNLDGDLALRFNFSNIGNSTIEIGSVGFPAEFNSIFTHHHPADATAACSLSEPYIGMDAGQIRITPIKGTGSALVVTALTGTNSPMEAYRNLLEPGFEGSWYGSQTFEGFYEWQVLTKAWAENEWAVQKAQPWNPPSSRMLNPGSTLQFGVRFSVVPEGVRGFDKAVRKTGHPTAISIPGYILPRDLPGKLFLQADSSVANISVDPHGSLSVVLTENAAYTLTPGEFAWGRARVTVTYDDGKIQTIHYYITKPAPETIQAMGHFLTTEAHFTDEADPFGRAPSIITYDCQSMSMVTQDPRAWVPGLSDEGGAGAYIAATVTQAIYPDADEVGILDALVNNVVWGNIQQEDYVVRNSLFFYEPAEVPDFTYNNFDWTSWSSWKKDRSHAADRAYNYVHPSAAYWSLYRVGRAYPELVSQDWSWYLEKAYRTALRISGGGVAWVEMGLMGETVWGIILTDLLREGFNDQAAALEALMKSRAEHWDSVDAPFGSEMAWDSTAQEGVYYWARHFGFKDLAKRAVDTVLGFTPNVPHWGWNGNAHRYWDFDVAGKLRRLERQIHHYGSALNSQVLLSAFRDDPSDSYLLRTGHGGSFAPLSSINEAGCPSAGFHSFPDTLQWDGFTADYGPGFLGMALNTGTYVAEDEQLGLVAYGGEISIDGSNVMVEPRDPVRKRVFIGPLAVLITVDVGVIEQFSYDVNAKSIYMTLSQLEDAPRAMNATVWTDSAQVSWEVSGYNVEVARGGWKVPLGQERVNITLSPRSV
ncbi:hypothetical protein CFIO01_13716 [Colletotrichum fioriniae PJ7]|uniref:Glycoside hydrolase family 43 protein n=1 Tax=Colletotrichum fioriniae PJ7 TaxID=1445577 RepID=A0A010R8P4_9PEZI|nr:hypothetical protein CFIO01_13716 [Colletotrichum fioriniae PJ7]